MTSRLVEVNQAIADTISNEGEWRVAQYTPEGDIMPPLVVVSPVSGVVETFGRGIWTHQFQLTLLTAMTTMRAGEEQLYELVDAVFNNLGVTPDLGITGCAVNASSFEMTGTTNAGDSSYLSASIALTVSVTGGTS